MALFNWFGKKPSDAQDAEASRVAHRGAEATQGAAERSHTPQRGAPDSHSARKQERLERRESLYRVVRECMTQAGVLSSSYKFKVLSLDSHGRQYLIMVDIPQAHAGDAPWCAHIEGLIARHAKSQHEILVTAVYWRITEVMERAAPTSQEPAPTAVDKKAALDQLFATQSQETPPDFQDTEVTDHGPELGKTQYGDLR